MKKFYEMNIEKVNNNYSLDSELVSGSRFQLVDVFLVWVPDVLWTVFFNVLVGERTTS